jgi:hypothetical protein
MAHTEPHGEHPVGPVGHETTDADLGSAERIGIVSVVLLLIIFGIVSAMYAHFRTLAARLDVKPLPISGRQGDRVPPLPRLQRLDSGDMEELPAGHLREFRAAEDAVLNGYAWVDKENGIARVPIDRAMELVVEKGLPHWTASEAKDKAAP